MSENCGSGAMLNQSVDCDDLAQRIQYEGRFIDVCSNPPLLFTVGGAVDDRVLPSDTGGMA